MGRRMAKPGFDLVHITAGSIQFGSEDRPKLSKLDSMYRNDKQEQMLNDTPAQESTFHNESQDNYQGNFFSHQNSLLEYNNRIQNDQ